MPEDKPYVESPPKTDSVPNGHPIVTKVDTESHPSGGAGVVSIFKGFHWSRYIGKDYLSFHKTNMGCIASLSRSNQESP